MNFLTNPVKGVLTAILLLLLISFAACSDNTENVPRNFVAYSWSQPDEAYSNIIPFHWLKSENAESMPSLVAAAVNAAQAMPKGHRVLFSWDIHRSISFQTNGDFIYEANGEVAGCNSKDGFRPYRSLWWENGVADVRQYFTEFFKLYRQAGGELDVFVLDYEQGFSYWHLLDLVEKNYPCGIDHYLDAIQNDSRFSVIKDITGIEDLKSIKLWFENDAHLKWSAYVWKHLANYIDRAIYQPLKAYYPNAEISNYGYYYQSSEFELPDIYGSNKHKYTDGIHIGTHQSREIYGWMNLPAGTKLAGIEYLVTPFNAFQFSLNKLRAMLLSSAVPVSPWVAYKSFTHSHLKDNDFYQELIFHTLLSGVDYLLYWNPSKQADYSKKDDHLLNQLLDRVNVLINDRKLSYKTNEMISWLDDIVITKIQLAQDLDLWRVSADIGIDEQITEMVVQDNPAKIKINGSLYEFDSMKVMHQSEALSDKGLWLISN